MKKNYCVINSFSSSFHLVTENILHIIPIVYDKAALEPSGVLKLNYKTSHL